MASLVLSSFCFRSQKPCSFTSSSLRFSIGAPAESRFGGPLFVGFGSVKKRNGRIEVSVDSTDHPLVFRDLDADDFRHPLDKQVRFSMAILINFLLYTIREKYIVWILDAEYVAIESHSRA